MKILPIALIIFGIIVIAAPEIIGWLIGGFFIFVGLNMLAFFGVFKKKSPNGEDYVKFGKYKIYR